jgi:tRNA threonylcarbamoyladenosine biosynthesis protein TsaE
MEINFNETELGEVANQFLSALGDVRIVTFEGDLGAGKTTLILSICRSLGVEDDMGSPTFPIIHEYADKDGKPVYHIDLYRLNDAREAIQAGVQDCLDSGHYCFVEWPVRAPSLFSEGVAHCRIQTCGTNTRSLELKL